MKTNVLSLISIVAGVTVASLAHGQAPAEPTPGLQPPNVGPALLPGTGPKIQFAEPNHDFGKVSSGAVVRHEYVFTNTGDANLEITAVRPGCGCTTSGEWSKLVEPGKTGKIPIQLNTLGFGGQVAKSVTVTCNDPAQPNVVLQIKGTIWKPIDVNPSFAYFNVAGDTATNETRVVRIINNTDEPLKLSEPECTNQTLRVELKTVKPDKEFELHVTTVPPLARGLTQTPINIKTTSTNSPLLTVTATINVQPPVIVMPSQITLPPSPIVSSNRYSVAIRNNQSQPITVSEPTANVPGLELKLEQLQPGRMFNIWVTVPAGFELPAGPRAEITLKTSHAEFAEVKVPIVQMPRPTPPVMIGPQAPGTATPVARPVPILPTPPAAVH